MEKKNKNTSLMKKEAGALARVNKQIKITNKLLKRKKMKNDLKELNLKGKVKKIIESKYKALDTYGYIKKGDIESRNFILFNSKGNKIEMNEYVDLYDDGNFICKLFGSMMERE